MAFKVIWSAAALEDLRSLTHYISTENPEAAERVGTQILAKVDLLTAHPKLGRIVPERRTSTIRELFRSPFRIVYRMQNRERRVEILRIWHAARGEPKLS